MRSLLHIAERLRSSCVRVWNVAARRGAIHRAHIAAGTPIPPRIGGAGGLALLLITQLSACSCASDETPIDAAVADVAIDAPTDALLDAPSDLDANDDDASAVVVDAGADSGVDSSVDAGGDANFDAGADATDPCELCLPEHACQGAACVDGTCVREALDDLSLCDLGEDAGTSAWCVAGECVVAECGDGVVAIDEACDDGNDLDSDACSNQCAWQRHTLYESGAFDAVLMRGRGLAVDGLGTLIAVWVERVGAAGPTEVRARRMLASGEVLDDTWLVLNSGSTAAPAPVVVGLSGGGFAVSLVSMGQLYVRTISASGQLSALTAVAGAAMATGSSIGAVGTGFVVTWSGGGNLYAQRYAAGGTSVGARITVNSSAGHMANNNHSGASIASVGDDWIAVWTRLQMPGDPVQRTVYGRRFRGGTALDASEQLYSAYGLTAIRPVVIARPDSWLVAYAQAADSGDVSGEIYTRSISSAGVIGAELLESEVDIGDPVTEGWPVLCGYDADDYLLAWHLRTQETNARAILGSQHDGATPVPELDTLNMQIERGSRIEGLSCAATADGVWVAWTSSGDIRAQLIPHPPEAP